MTDGQPARFGESEGYAGPAVLGLADDGERCREPDWELPVEVHLRGHFQPIDGRFHWWGRVAHSPDLAATVTPGATVALTTAHGTAVGRLSDVDPWGRFRIAGTGPPPY